MADGELPRTLPAAAYHDPDWYARERRAVFATTWQLAGFRAQLTRPGDYVTHELAGWSVLVTVDDDGRLRAFHNVCRHRAGPVCTDACGHAAALVCGYHGWTYALDGTLRRARDFGAEVDPAEYGLLPVEVDEWRGLVFVRLAAPDPAPSLIASLGGLVERCTELPMESLVYGHRLVHTVAANWKTYTDNYGEGYHVPFVHPRLHRQIDAQQYHVHVHDGWVEHTAPARDGALATGAWLWRHPNLGLNLSTAGMNVERWVPDGPRRTRVIYDFFFADPGDAAQNREVERFGIEVLDEDRRVCEAVQRNLESGAYETGLLSPRHEQGVHAFQTWVRDAMARDQSVVAASRSRSSASEFTQ
ncbi:MAG: aromatic ring-hydroxylating oxygenase subunit alpha [Acidimicrobiia bacterium]